MALVACGDDDPAEDASSGGGASSGGTQEAVATCFGDCPTGECDDKLFFADVECNQSIDIGSDADLCPSTTLGYCLTLENGSKYAVDCQAATKAMACSNGCGIAGGSKPECS